MRPIALLCLLLPAMLAGCSILPQWRVFQAKIDPKLAEKAPTQIEAERRAAALIVDLSNPLFKTEVMTEGVRLAKIHEVAAPLSASLGEPLKRATVFEVPAVVADTRVGLLAEQKRAEQWKAFARKYAGKELEDTGVNLAGPAGLLGLAAVVAACIACPTLGWVLLRVLPVLWSGLKRAVSFGEQLAKAAPSAAASLKAALPQRENAVRKIVRLAKPATS